MNEINQLMTPQVSIILPVYNRKRLIMRAIDSVQQQTFGDWELLIIDDGSDDGLHDLILPHLAVQPRWRYLKHANRKLAASRNIGIHAALGRIITFLDADDQYLPDHLSLRLTYLQQHPNVQLIHGGAIFIGPEETHWVRDAYHPERLIHLSECVIGATLFGYKQVFIQSGGFKLLPYSAESEFVDRVEKTVTVHRVAFATYVYHTGLPDSICTLRKQKNDS
ncbi:glycosyltransferase family 2 protein [candidate division KSB1 bacterium]|nr:glycosyltransferase family 2 protein [candidate division KSB1 bacterium]